MIRKAKRSSAANFDDSGHLGSVFGRRAFATRGACSDAKGSGASSHRLRSTLLAAPFALALLIAPAAQAATPAHPFLGAFCESTGLGTPPCDPTFTAPSGVAVDQSSGDLLVIDSSAGTLSRYHEDGTPANFSALGTNVIDGEGSGPPCTPPSVECDGTPENELSFGGANEVQVAVDSSGTATDGDIYVTQSGEHLIDIFSAEGEYLGQLTKAGATDFGEACGVAVDESGSVYVGDYEGEVHKFEPAANPPLNTDNTDNFAASEPCAVAAGAGPSAGSIFVTSYLGEVTKLDSSTGAPQYGGNPIAEGATTVSVDPVSGHLYVAKGQEILEYDASGVSLAATEPFSTIAPGEGAFRGVAVNEASGDVYVTRAGSTHVEVYGPLSYGTQEFKLKVAKTGTGTGVVQCEVEGGLAEPCPESPTLYLEGTEIVLTATPALGSTFAGFSGGGCSTSPCTLTLEANTTVTATFNQLPPTVANDPVGAVTQTTAVLNGHVNNNNDPAGSACFFEVATASDPTFSAPVATPTCAPTPVTGSANTAVSATATGLSRATEYIYRVRATNAGGTSKAAPAELFTTPVGPPQISEELASPVAGTTATLNAKVNPSGLATNYRFEWGTSASYDHRVPAEFDLFAGSGNQPIAVTAHLTDLALSTTYHFRLVATNSAGPTNGPDVAFTTNNFSELNSAGLPDNRRFELVSPPDKRPQGVVKPLNGATFLTRQVAEDGQSLLFPLLGGLKDTDSGGDTSYLATRHESGWQSTKVSPPSLVPAPTTGDIKSAASGAVVYYSPDLSCGVINTFNPLTADTPAADVELGVVNLYRRNPDGSHTLVTSTVPANPGVPVALGSGASPFIVAGASEDCSRIYFQSGYQYLPDASGLYEWDEGTLRDAGRLPNGATPVGQLSLFSTPISAVLGGEWGTNGANGTRVNSVSRDGSRFFFTAFSNEGGDSGKPAVFVRKDPGDIVDASQKIPGGTKENLGARYETASPDGSHVFFTANYGLTPISSNGPTENCSNTVFGSVKACDLYDYDVTTGQLKDLSADSNSADTNGAVVQGVVAVSRDGSSVYFVARGQLVPGAGKTYAQNTSGAGSANLYLARGGQLTYVATVAAADMNASFGDGVLVRTSAWKAEATPDGDHLLFPSHANLTAYESGEAVEAYLYSTDSGTTQCVSCKPVGSGSLGGVELLPSFPSDPSDQAQPRKMSDDGSRVFFTIGDVLAPGAVSGNVNLYEWERGQIYLLATGAQVPGLVSQAPELYGASNSGDDVFFSTPQQLDPRYDIDFVRDAYDARVGGGFPDPPPPPVPCNVASSECQGSETPQPAGLSPASQSSSGEGNPPLQPPRCPKGKVRKHGKCVPKKHHKKKHRAANTNRGGAQ